MTSPLPNTGRPCIMSCGKDRDQERQAALVSCLDFVLPPLSKCSRPLPSSWVSPGPHGWPVNHWILPKPDSGPHVSCGARTQAMPFKVSFLGWVPAHWQFEATLMKLALVREAHRAMYGWEEVGYSWSLGL